MTSSCTNKSTADVITRFTNCLLVQKNGLVESDLFVNSVTGRIVSPQDSFYKDNIRPTRTVNLGGRILSPGFIDVQLNGACGFDFSVIPGDGSEAAMVEYEKGLAMANKGIVRTGVTSYLPTLITQKKEVYAKVAILQQDFLEEKRFVNEIPQAIPRLAAPPTTQRIALAGAESLGVHCEGPFLNPERNGIHSRQILQHPSADLASLEDVYNASNLTSSSSSSSSNTPPAIKMITIAPELLSQPFAITSTLQSRGIILSAGHSTATYEQFLASNITMTTHLFNAMDQPQQRAPGIPGAVLGEHSQTRYYGIISDGIHVHPANISLAYRSNSEGCILVTDAMRWAGLDDGVYDWTNGEKIRKRGNLLVLEGTDKIAGR